LTKLKKSGASGAESRCLLHLVCKFPSMGRQKLYIDLTSQWFIAFICGNVTPGHIGRVIPLSIGISRRTLALLMEGA